MEIAASAASVIEEQAADQEQDENDENSQKSQDETKSHHSMIS